MQYLQDNLFPKCLGPFLTKTFFCHFTFFKQNKIIQVNKINILKIFTTLRKISLGKRVIFFTCNFINFFN